MKPTGLDLLLPPVKPRTVGHGYLENPGNRIQIAVRFTEEQFNKIRMQALRENKSFSEMVVTLCEVGHLCLTESDALEPENQPATPTLVPGK